MIIEQVIKEVAKGYDTHGNTPVTYRELLDLLESALEKHKKENLRKSREEWEELNRNT